MKKMKKIFALLIAMVMVLGMSTSVFAATQTKALSPADEDNATITINNPAKGETYSVFKLFDATVGENGEISYQCTGAIPEALTSFFTKDASNNVIPDDSILVKDDQGKVTGSKMTDELKAALESWANSATATASEVSDGSDKLAFTGLPYGYYVMTTSHVDDEAAKALITVSSTQPDAVIYDKNNTEVEAKEKKVYKTEDIGDDGNPKEGATPIETVSIGQEVTFVAKFDTTNYVANGTGNDGDESKQVFKYVISDTLPEYLTEVTITKVTVDGTALNPTPSFTDKKFEIAWTDGEGNSLYKQGAEIVVTYTAKISSTININTANTNTISIQPWTDDDTPYDEPFSTENVVKTYGAAIKKVDQDGNPLPGAQFTIKGLTVTGSAGEYTVVSYNAAADADESAVLDTNDDGVLYIVGLASDVKLTVTEFKAPDGYNKLTETKELTPQVMTEAIYTTSGVNHYDAKGNLIGTDNFDPQYNQTVEKNLDDLDADALVIENQKGTLLPSTGGIGTTIFYVIGAILVIGAGVVLVTRRRMNAN